MSRLLQHLRGFSHQQSVERLKLLGFVPRVIYDIGAYHGKWTRAVRRIYPCADYLLFEANLHNTPILNASAERYFIVALAHEDAARREFYLPQRAIATGASLYKEQSSHYVADNLRIEMLETRRLDTFCAQHELTSPDLIKLDVQGAELDVLAGAGDLLKACTAIIAELSFLGSNEGAPLAADVISGIEKLGFKCTDVCKLRRAGAGNVGQIDILFTRAALYERFRAAAGLR